MIDQRFRAIALSIAASAMMAAAAVTPASARQGFEPPAIAPGTATPIVFVDALKQSTPWMSSSPLALDGDGQVTALAPGQTAARLVYAMGQRHPVGDYTLLYDGAGSFGFDGATVVAQSPGRILVDVSSPNGPLVMHLLAINPRDPVRDLRLVLPGFAGSDQSYPFYPPYVQALAGAETLRFGAWSNVQTNTVSSVWPLRPRASRVTQAMAAGVAPEYEIALANATGADPWFVLPVGATDGYVYGVASLVHSLLDPRLHPSFEYGDRIWADDTPENAYARMAARNFRLPGDATTAALEWYALRSTQVFAVVGIAFGPDAREVLDVLSLPGASDAASQRAARTILTYAHAGQRAQMLVIDATDEAAYDNAATIAAQAGGPREIWHPLPGGRMIGDGMAMRVPVTPRADLTFAVGPDTTSQAEGPEHRVRPLPALPLVVGPPKATDAETLAAAPATLQSVLRAQTATSGGDPLDELTYHNDLLRTGWNPNETVLNTTNVAGSGFGYIQTLTVDGDVLAQPLYIHQYVLAGVARDILVVATEHDSVYEFDADSGALIKHVSLGTSQSSSDVGCEDIRPEYGITSTPVIDRASGRIYVVAATEPSASVFQMKLHALDIATLADQITPVAVTASTVLSNGTVVTLNQQNQMNRPGLMLSGGSIYVGIGSHCDNDASNIVGWVLQYNSTLAQTAKFATTEDTDSYLLSSVWMTGFAPAADEKGDVYIATGNGSFDADHAGGKNFGESVLRLPPDLSSVTDFFTPANWNTLNGGDTDFGSGGVMLLPAQPDSVKYTAVAQGKFSTLYLLNRSHLGQVKAGDKGALQSIPNTGSGVWGGPAYYSGPSGQFVYYQADSAPLLAFSLAPNGSGVPQLTLSSSGSSDAGYGGSLPIVSSNKQVSGTAIVWLVKRSSPLQLEAYNATNVSKPIFSHNAGSWSNPQDNGFLTPLEANGRVYVASTNQVQVFGLVGSQQIAPPAASVRTSGTERRLTGTIVRVAANTLTLRLRDGRIRNVDIAPARAARHVGVLPIGRAVVVYGWVDKAGTFHVASIGHTSQNRDQWSPDL